MRLKINLAGFLEEIKDVEAIPYLLKMYMREVLDFDIHIDPKNPYDTEFISDTADINYQYNIDDTEFSITIDYKSK